MGGYEPRFLDCSSISSLYQYFTVRYTIDGCTYMIYLISLFNLWSRGKNVCYSRVYSGVTPYIPVATLTAKYLDKTDYMISLYSSKKPASLLSNQMNQPISFVPP